jgi:MerR family Zn(II)-responsive transcriptional regulator of zntA
LVFFQGNNTKKLSLDLRYNSKVYTLPIFLSSGEKIVKISQLAKRCGISAHTLRYYEKAGLFKASGRTISNYRIYNHDDLLTAKFIKHCKESGFSLPETASLLRIKDDKSQHVCAEAKAITEDKITQITQQIEHLRSMLMTLKRLNQYCCGGDESAQFCSIIAKLENGE